jgi:hypothetical protein
MENIVISIEKFETSEDRFLYVRMPNKCIAFSGKFMKNFTEHRILNNSVKNFEIKKLLLVRENVQPVFVKVKIQFKEESVGERFKKAVE